MKLRERLKAEEKKLTPEQIYNLKSKEIDLKIAKQRNAVGGEHKATALVLIVLIIALCSIVISVTITSYSADIKREEIEKELVLRGYSPTESVYVNVPKWSKKDTKENSSKIESLDEN